ncbi:protein DEPP1 [Megalops cyprinoides]|uniref:protein DEPP1 n=1 Tax=Megalops cyprinoides TaxID=118141 RepID=UPI0018651451|nr:protein DEPP1 [Megalops cyprinoides]
MRPRSRLLAKKRLPTIREGYEELLQDMNQANSYHAPCHAHHDVLSSEDYLKSICQLARPTFPLQEPDNDILTLGQLEALKPGLRLPRISAPPRPLTPTARSYGRREEQQRRDKAGCSVLSHIVALPDGVTPHLGKDGCHGAPDPLEYLYGHRSGPASSARLSQDAKGRLGQGEVPVEGGARPGSRPLPRAHSFPRLCSPRHTCRKSSCPEINLEDSPSPSSTPSASQPFPPKERKPSSSRLPSQKPQDRAGSAPCGQKEKCVGSTDKHSMISNWIADCRSAWRETRIRACMLPTIAEI